MGPWLRERSRRRARRRARKCCRPGAPSGSWGYHPVTGRRHWRFTMPGSVIASSARTPIGKLSGALASFSAMDLGGVAIKAALERAGIEGDQVDYVIMGQV